MCACAKARTDKRRHRIHNMLSQRLALTESEDDLRTPADMLHIDISRASEKQGVLYPNLE